ncbi:TRAP transporter substrate-binding protein DctP [Cloacibacillus porcorum]|uniref:TRAP transporter substrate-binding protein DctP n=1 Tax=Cloacibacillus porcorum TaxID=1197717 RepID=UPI0023EFE3B2|nr:TRAP transporter substrate-binding protein DctP [Cloacibacillus porcorum]MDD7649148.1 TRAP transporter substrate-binding protein DctP [Cloacibacillus porcorum]MDY4094778.1 TRAP transporter substrate-binding protein DctP [Cloacibacillus porcorum]
MKKQLVMLTLIVCSVLLTSQALASPKYSLRFAGQFALNHYVTAEMQAMADEIAKKTDGDVQITVFPANQLGDYTLIYEDIIRGTVDMCMNSFPSQFDKRLEMVYMNGFIRGPEDILRAINPDNWMFKKIDSMQRVFGIKMLGMYFEGVGGYASIRPIKDPLDPKVPKGVLLRIPNMAVYKLSAEATGYRTVTIPWADVYQSLQTGVCDAVTGFSPSACDAMLGDVIKHYYVTINSVEFLNIAISAKTWDKLPEKYKDVIQEVVSKYSIRSVEIGMQENDKAIKALKDKGIKVYQYTPQELLPLANAYVSTWDQMSDRMTKELIEEFKKEMAPK